MNWELDRKSGNDGFVGENSVTHVSSRSYETISGSGSADALRTTLRKDVEFDIKHSGVMGTYIGRVLDDGNMIFMRMKSEQQEI